MSKNLPQIATAARKSQNATGCPGLLSMAQCALETGWLKNAPENNCFGIKDYHGSHGRQLLTTHEWFNLAELLRFKALGDGRTAVPDEKDTTVKNGRRKYVVQDWFATFAELGDCFAKRAAMWDKGPYAAAAEKFKADGDLEALVHGIAPIYATDPGYAKSVLSIINEADVKAAWEATA